MGVFEHVGAYKHTGGKQKPPKYKTCLPLRKSRKNLFKAKSLHLKELEIIIREPPDHTGNEPTLDILIRGSEQDIKK